MVRFAGIIFLLSTITYNGSLVAGSLSSGELHAFNKKVQKYHKGLSSIRPIKGSSFSVAPNKVISVPPDFLNDRDHSLYHEVGHVKLNHAKKTSQFLKHSGYLEQVQKHGQEKGPWIFGADMALHQREQEREADEAIPNSPDLLLKARDFFYAMYKKGSSGHSIKNRTYESHPLPIERAERFNERYRKLLLGHSVSNDAKRLALGIPPVITGTMPIKAAAILGLDKDYYLSLSKDAQQFRSSDHKETVESEKHRTVLPIRENIPNEAKKILGLDRDVDNSLDDKAKEILGLDRDVDNSLDGARVSNPNQSSFISKAIERLRSIVFYYFK